MKPLASIPTTLVSGGDLQGLARAFTTSRKRWASSKTRHISACPPAKVICSISRSRKFSSMLPLVSGSGGRGVDYKVGEGRRGLAEFPPPPHPRLHVRHVSSIDERDACDAVHDCHPVRLVEQLQPLTVPAFPPGALNQLVERWRGEPA